MKAKIILTGLQIKSLKKAQKLAYALNIIEEECGIRSIKITFKKTFFCDWINIKKLNKTPMQRLIKDIFK